MNNRVRCGGAARCGKLAGMAELDRATPVGIVGAGTMGAGIAQVAAVAGHPVCLYDAVPGAAEEAIAAIRVRLARLTEKGRIDPQLALDTSDRLTAAGSVAELRDSGLVIEAVIEDLGIKRDLFATIEALCGPDTILATNTSSLSITEIAAGLGRPQRLAGMHFFNPAPLLPLVEVVAGKATDPEVMDTLVATAAAWGKTPVRCASTPGFIVNRVARPYYAEAFRLLSTGTIDPVTVDAVLRESGGFRMGPCELTDLIGQDVNAAVTRSVWEAFNRDPRFEPSELQNAMVAAGRLGKKSGGGFYASAANPEPSAARPRPHPDEVVITGAGGPLEDLVSRLESAGVAVRRTNEEGPVRIRPADGVVIQLTDGRPAAEVTAEDGEPTFLVDVALDFGTTTRLAVAGPPTADPHSVGVVVGCLQATGATVTLVADTPGLVVGRTVAMLAAFGADAVDAGVASATDVDTAMRLGVNYPRGPVEWGDALGWSWVAGVLDALATSEDPQRYRLPEGVVTRRDAGRTAAGGPEDD
jgi:3-hydroxybutyryl-CoA dehydrogenase